MFDCLCCCVIYCCLQDFAPPKHLGSSSPTTTSTTAPISTTTNAATATATATAAASALAGNIGKTVVLIDNGMCTKWVIVGCVPEKGLYTLSVSTVTSLYFVCKDVLLCVSVALSWCQ
jgi:hypothetical protein